jgi:hypothetical protein
MASKEKLTRQRKAAEKIADIMLSSLQKFPEAEQEARIARIERISVRHTRRKKTTKRASIRQSPRSRQLPAGA